MHKKFFLVDDDVDDHALFCDALHEIDSKNCCETATDGYKAVEKIKMQASALPDVIFLDINIPSNNGWYFLDLIKKDELIGHIPVIMYSTSSIDTDAAKAIKNGGILLFTKPDDFNELKSCLKIIIRFLENGNLHTLSHADCVWFQNGKEILNG